MSGISKQSDRETVIVNYKQGIHTYPEELALAGTGLASTLWVGYYCAGHIISKLWKTAISSPLTAVTIAQFLTNGGAQLLTGKPPSKIISLFPYQENMKPLAFPYQWLYGAKVALTDYFWFSMYGLYKTSGIILKALTYRRTSSSYQ